MKSFKDMFLGEEKENYYEVKQSVKFSPEEAGKDNPGKVISFDYGEIVAVEGEFYRVKLPGDVVIKVHNRNCYAFGNADADPAP
jgi:hypothetical protein